MIINCIFITREFVQVKNFSLVDTSNGSILNNCIVQYVDVHIAFVRRNERGLFYNKIS